MIRRVASLFFVMMFLLLAVSALHAHGGGDLIAGPEQVGPYIVSVWLNPPDPRATEPIHFTVGLASPIDREAVLDAQIMVEMRLVGNDTLAASSAATTDQSINKLFYETDMQVSEANAYETTFLISGPAGNGALTVPVNVSEPSNINWIALGLFGLALIIILGWWRSRSRAVNQPKIDEINLNTRSK